MKKKPRKHDDYERDFEFTLILEGISEVDEDAADALYEAGCDDATISVRSGRVCMTFCRKAKTLRDAIISAVLAVREADIGATVLRIDECDLVTQADIGRRVGHSRQLVHQWISGIRGPGSFPAPVCNITEGMPLWLWCEVAYWLWQHDFISERYCREANEIAVINNVLELAFLRQIGPGITDEVVKILRIV